MEYWKWVSVRFDSTKFLDFYMRVIRKYCNITGSIKINWKINSKKYKFVFDQIDEDIFGVEVYELIDEECGTN